MKCTRLTKILIVGLFIAFSPLLVLWYNHYQNDHFACESEAVVNGKGYTFSSIVHFSFRGGTGTFDALGKYQAPGKPLQQITQKLDFEYWHEGHHLVLISKENDRDQTNIELLSPVIPDFFLLRARGISLKFLPQNSTGYLVFEDNMPVLYCIRTNH